MKQAELDLEGGESRLQKYIEEGKEIRKAHRAKPEVSSRPISSATDAPKLFDVIKSKGGGGGAGAGGDLEKGMMGGRMKKPSYCAGGKVKSASKRADGIAIRGKTRA